MTRSPGTRSSRACRCGRPVTVIDRFSNFHVRAELAQRQLGVIARAHRLVNGGAAIGI